MASNQFRAPLKRSKQGHEKASYALVQALAALKGDVSCPAEDLRRRHLFVPGIAILDCPEEAASSPAEAAPVRSATSVSAVSHGSR
ncbi:hypothetical protein OG252_44945 [Streptomyces sp. NBC_01352]|uniref:hypothetical protein n=1 Tax=Streptomyces sp. NBC_01352 TaxID=2903834 RepID=UPI002E357A64|nr:hypothetical protein [Streptomyces sp. NBC_01352]